MSIALYVDKPTWVQCTGEFRERVLELSGGEFAGWLDADDITQLDRELGDTHAEAIALLKEALDSHKEGGMVRVWRD